MIVPVRLGVPADVPSWVSLALKVEELFGPMPEIRRAIERGIDRGTALATGSVGSVTGGMLLSRDDRPHSIHWLAVDPNARQRGLGGALIRAALDRWPTGDIEVITFAETTVGGAPARTLYESIGFDLVGPTEHAADGELRDRYVMRR
ncbi:MAG: GNAT family N-acetyltransferase [Humibacillus sp.]|nr:GNAT family N-acetyltransferase [Humibacillus sp.]MDN5775932.1 GNAT family N-acetyltransferase [Humibacillus sp.]